MTEARGRLVRRRLARAALALASLLVGSGVSATPTSDPPGLGTLPPSFAPMSTLWPAVSPCPWGDVERCWLDAEALTRAGHAREAVARLGQACVSGKDLACEHWAFRVGRDADATVDPFAAGRATWAHRDLCAWGKAIACYNAGQSFRRGTGVTVDHAEAMRLFDVGCHELDLHQACAALAFHYLEGLGVDKDPTRGRLLLEGSGDADNAVACFNLGKVLVDLVDEGPKGDALIRNALTRACDLGHPDACGLLDEADDDPDAQRPAPGARPTDAERAESDALLSRLRGLADQERPGAPGPTR